jgi:hypothetical protein
MIYSISVGLYAQDIRVTSTSMAGISIHSPLADLRAKGITIPEKMDTSEFGFPAFKTTINGATIQIEVIETYDETSQAYKARVFSLHTSDPRAATPSGVRMGTNKFEAIKMLDGKYLEVRPDYRKQESNLPEATKRRYSVVVLTDGENGTMLTMYFLDQKLYAFMVSVYEGY